jgi:putative isomerase
MDILTFAACRHFLATSVLFFFMVTSIASELAPDSLAPLSKPERDSLAAKCIRTLIANRQAPVGGLKHEGVFPSRTDFPGFWAWDSWKHAFALASVDPELAKNQVRAMFDYQDSCGMIADCIFADTAENNYRDTKPPLSAWAVQEIFRATADTAFVREMYPKLLKYHKWWYTHRDHDGNGLCEYGSTDGTLQAARWESGWDNAVRFDSARMVQNNSHAWSMNQESADLNAYLCVEKECLSELAAILSREDESNTFRTQALDLAGLVRSAMWDPETGFFYDVTIGDRQLVRVAEPNGWIPLWAGIATPDQASRIVSHILDTAEFNTLVPFPTVAANNRSFNPSRGYWRGPVWLDQAYFAINGMKRYGYHREAAFLMTKLIRNCRGLLTPGIPIRENYHPLTGEGLNSVNFSWSAAHLLMMLREN